MNNNERIAADVLAAVGGKDNITFVTHCMTRLRFNLKDKSIPNIDKIKEIEGTLGVIESGGQLQIIIGQNVDKVYISLCDQAGIKQEKAVDEDLDEKPKKFSFKSLFNSMLDGLVGSITPLIPMLIGGGMIKVIAVLINVSGLLPKDNTTYQILTWLGDAFTYFLPVFLGATAAKKFGANQGIGMLLGALLIAPNFIASVSAGTKLTMLGLPVYAGKYASTVLPIILTVWVLSKVERFITKICPDLFKSFLIPMLSLIIMTPIMLVAVAPLGFYIGSYISSAVLWIYAKVGFVGVAILAACKPLLVMTGMHIGFLPYCINSFATVGYEGFFIPASIISNMNQGAACLAVSIKAKNKDLKSTALSSAVSAIIPGVTEPAVYGITLKYKKPMIASMIGGAVAGAIAGLLKVVCYVLPGTNGIFSIPMYIGPAGSLLKLIFVLVIGVVVTFISTLLLGFNEDEVA